MESYTGILYLDETSVSNNDMKYARDGLPDWARAQQNIFTDGWIGLGAKSTTEAPLTQLSIAGSTLILIGGGRIDNRPQLHEKLDMLSDKKNISDAMLFLRAYAQLGKDCVDSLRGQFSFAIYDTNRKSLFLATDQLGSSLIYYAIEPGKRFIFASHAGIILSAPGFSPQLNVEKIIEISMLMFPSRETTIYQNILALPPAHSLEISVESKKPQMKQYFQLSFETDESIQDTADNAHQFRQIFREAVYRNTNSYGSIGCHLSGGLDSSSVAVMAADILRERNKTLTAYGSLPAFGLSRVKRPNWIADDIAVMMDIANSADNIDFIPVRTTERSLFDDLEKYYTWADRPILNPCNRIWIEEIATRAQQTGIETLLTGAYGNFTISWAGNNAPISGIISLLRMFKRHLRYWRDIAKMRATGQTLYDSFSYVKPDLKRDKKRLDRFLITRSIAPGTERRWFFNHGAKSNMKQIYEATHGVSHQDPTYDLDVVEFCLRQPSHVYTRGNSHRLLIRDAMEGLLPDNARLRTQRGMQLPDWQHHFVINLPNFKSKLEKFQKNPLICEYFDLPRMRQTLEQWPAPHMKYGDLESQFRHSWMRGFFLANFVDWFYEKHVA